MAAGEDATKEGAGKTKAVEDAKVGFYGKGSLWVIKLDDLVTFLPK